MITSNKITFTPSSPRAYNFLPKINARHIRERNNSAARKEGNLTDFKNEKSAFLTSAAELNFENLSTTVASESVGKYPKEEALSSNGFDFDDLSVQVPTNLKVILEKGESKVIETPTKVDSNKATRRVSRLGPNSVANFLPKEMRENYEFYALRQRLTEVSKKYDQDAERIMVAAEIAENTI